MCKNVIQIYNKTKQNKNIMFKGRTQLSDDLISSLLQVHSKKLLGCFNPSLGQIWTNPATGLNFLIIFLKHLKKKINNFFKCLNISNPKFGFVHI